MNVFQSIMQNSIAGMNLQSRRMGVLSENISNADTPGYQRKVLQLKSEIGTQTSGIASDAIRVSLDKTEGVVLFSPSHPMADANGYVEMSNVSMITELADMREASRSYDANLNSFQQARDMYRSLLDLLRR